MTEENKRFLLKDLCSRIPYGVKCKYNCVVPICDRQLNVTNNVSELSGIDTLCGVPTYMLGSHRVNALSDDIRPYLRPLSSMTKKELDEIKRKWTFCEDCRVENVMNVFHNRVTIEIGDIDTFVDWLNSHHFDYRGLIGEGLALEAPEGMYEIK